MKIGLTLSEANYSNYPVWLKGQEDIDIIELSFEKYNTDDVAICDGIVFTGGVDIMPENPDYKNAPLYFNSIRDKFESEVLKLAIEHKKPILGICRGLQLINTFLGGDLNLDLDEKNLIHKRDTEDKMHQVFVDKNSVLFEIVGEEMGEVNSAHHQSINQLAKGLIISATSADGEIEAVELGHLSEQFLIAVQWHPERMINQNSPFTKNIREAFLKRINNN